VDVIRQNGDCQSEVLAVFSEPGDPWRARRSGASTPIAAVFLAGDRASRSKRAVSLFLSGFFTLAQRRAACAAELEINRLLRPGCTSRDPVTREQRRLAARRARRRCRVGVEMRRFDETRTLDRLADDNAIGPCAPG